MKVQYRKILHEKKGWLLQTPEGELIVDAWNGNVWLAKTKKDALEDAKYLREHGTNTKPPIRVTLTIWTDEKGKPCTS